jgi:hypothetical protein
VLDALRSLRDDLGRLDRAVRAVRTKQVFQKSIKDGTRGVVDSYFRGVRDQILVAGLTQAELAAVDAEMQHLLDIGQKSSTVGTYRSQFKCNRCLMPVLTG